MKTKKPTEIVNVKETGSDRLLPSYLLYDDGDLGLVVSPPTKHGEVCCVYIAKRRYNDTWNAEWTPSINPFINLSAGELKKIGEKIVQIAKTHARNKPLKI